MSLLRGIRDAVGGEPEPAPKPVRAFAPLPPRMGGAGKLSVPLRPEPAPEAPPVSRPRPRASASAPVGAVFPPPRFQEDEFGPGYLMQKLRRHDNVAENSRVGTKNVHLSALSDFCQRAYYLADEEAKVLDQRPTGGHRVMWALGRAAEKHVRNGLISECQRVGVIGKWHCACKRSEVSGLWQEEARCETCLEPLDIYKEITLIDPDVDVAGNPDLMLTVGRRVLPVEIKSMNATAWKELEAPLPDHLFQGNGYHRLARRAGYDVMPVVAYLYVTKDFKWGEPYKEFHVAPDGMSERVQDIAWNEARSLKTARAAGRLPPRVKCAAMTDPRAKQCPVATSCFLRRAT